MATVNENIWTAIKMRFTQKAPKSSTKTYRPGSADQALPLIGLSDHLTDIFTSRAADDSRTLLKSLFKNDPDASAAVGAFLTMADTMMTIFVRNVDGSINPEATQRLKLILRALQFSTDYTLGYQHKKSLRIQNGELRWMTMLRGAIGAELVFNKNFVPDRIHNVDMADIEWYERAAGDYKPRQKAAGGGDPIDLNIPSFFTANYRQDPTNIYPQSDFVSAINTIASRQQVINDLYRIMQVTGFPRISLQVMEEVAMKNIPPAIAQDKDEIRIWLNARLSEIGSRFSGLRADQPFVHWDAVKPTIINDKNPGVGIQIDEVIQTLNAQNQAGLKTMATVIGRGQGNMQVASTEARLAAMNADQINAPLADLYERMFTFLINLMGIPGFVEVTFASAELRPWLELETQRVLQDTRLRQDLSHGLITDEEYHLKVHGRLPPQGVEPKMGTGFETQVAQVRTDDVSPNQGSLNRSLVPEGQRPGNGTGGDRKTTKAQLLAAGIDDDVADRALDTLGGYE